MNSLDFGYYGVSIAITITQALNLAILISYIYFKKLIGNTWFWFNKKSFENIGPQFIKQFFIGCLLYLEWLAFEGCLIIAGSLTEQEMAAQVIVFTILYFIYSLTYGLCVVLNTYLANSIGRGNKQEVFEYLKAGLIYFVIIVFIADSILYFYINDLVRLYTSQSDIKKNVENVCMMYLLILPGDYLQAVLSAILRSIGKEKIGTKIFIIAFYGIGLPTSYLCALNLKMGIYGLWVGLGVGAHVLLGQQLYVLMNTNWEYQIILIRKEVTEHKEDKESELISL